MNTKLASLLGFAVLLCASIIPDAHAMRWYSPSTGRWLSRDPIEEADWLNTYGFVRNDPCNVADIDGRITVPIVTLPLGLKCLAQGIKTLPAVYRLKRFFENDLDKNYKCCWKGKWDKKIHDWDYPDDEAVSFQVLHAMTGCKLREVGVTADCMAAFNLIWELGELAFTDEFKDKGSTLKERLIKYARDTFADAGALVGGYEVGPPDCEHRFIPGECVPINGD